MLTIDEIWAIPLNKRGDAFQKFTDDERRLLTRGYAMSAEAIADYLHSELDIDGVVSTYEQRQQSRH